MHSQIPPTLPPQRRPLNNDVEKTHVQYALLLWAVLGVFLAVGCAQPASPDAFVARVDNAYLTEEEVSAALANLPQGLDSVETRRQFINQWVTNELLFQEALRSNLRSQEDVQRRLAESERAVLIDALVSQLFEQSSASTSQAEMTAYFELNKEQLRLREPFVRVRYLYTTDADSARLARRLLLQSSTATADSVWSALTQRFAQDPRVSQSLAANYIPESRLFMEQPVLRERLGQLNARQTAPLFESNGYTHLLQLTDRVAAGSLPELSWIEDQVRRQLTLDTRKQMYERQVQRLRTEALSREVLVVK